MGGCRNHRPASILGDRGPHVLGLSPKLAGLGGGYPFEQRRLGDDPQPVQTDEAGIPESGSQQVQRWQDEWGAPVLSIIGCSEWYGI